MTFLAFTGLVNFLSSAALGILTFYKCPNKQVGRAYGWLNIWIAFWSFCYFVSRCATTIPKAMLSFQLLTIGIVWINQAFLYFTLTFLNQVPRFRKRLWGIAAVNTFFCFLVLTKTLFPIVVPKYGFGYWPVYTPWVAVYVTFWHAELLLAFGLLVMALRDTEGAKREQLKYMLAAFSIGYLGGGLVWLLWFDINFPPHPIILVSVYTALIAYAILRHQLMDITIIIRKTLLYSSVSAGVAAIYAGIVTLLAHLVESQPTALTVFPNEVFRWITYNLKDLFAYSCMATSLFSIALGSFVWFKGLRKPVHRLWMMFCLAVGLWSLGYGMMVRAGSYAEAYWWQQWVQYFGSIMIPVVYLHFVTLVAGIRSPRMLIGGYIFAVLLQMLNVRGLMVSIQILPPFNYYTKAFAAFYAFTIYFLSYTLYAHVLLIRRLLTVSDTRLKNQIKFILLGTAIGFCGGSTSFFMVYGINIFPYGVYAVPVYILTVSYAIVRHRLMDINVVIRKTLLYSLVSAVLASVYVGTITLLVQILGRRHGAASALSSALAAIVITLLFNPLRLRTQRWIDSHFPRERLDPELLQEAAGGFAHEMKRPLSKISIPAEMVLMDLERVESGEISWKDALPKVQERLRFIMNQSIDAGYMIEAIRELSASSVTPFVPVDIAKTIRHALVVEKELLEKNGAAVHLHLPESTQCVFGRARQLEIVFVNLIKNAAEAVSEKGARPVREIWIEAKSNESQVVVRVRDSGPGIRAEDIEKIFQAHYTTKGLLGTGMGLYLSHQIIQAHRGTIEVQNSGNQSGTVFSITIPTAPFR